MGQPIIPIGSISSGPIDPFWNLESAPRIHWPYFCGSGQLSNGSTRPIPIHTLSSTTAELLQRFDTVDQLIVDISIPHVSLQFLCGLVTYAQSSLGPANASLQYMRNSAIDNFSKCRLKVLNNNNN